MKPIRLILADDHLNVRKYLAARLRREPDFEIVDQVSDSFDTVRSVKLHQPCVLIIDPMMKDGRGLEAVKTLKTDAPDTLIVVLTAVVDTALRMDLTGLGVQQVFSKGIETNLLVNNLRRLVEDSQESSSQLPAEGEVLTPHGQHRT